MRNRGLIPILVALTFLLSACGTQSQQYAKSKEAQSYFTVPTGWKEISNERLSALEKKGATGTDLERANSVIWQVAYSPMKSLKPSQVYTLQSFGQPVVFARVRTLNFDEINLVSYNSLRSMILPLADWIATPSNAPSGFKVVKDFEIVDQGVRGVRSVFEFDNNGVNETFDQAVMVSDDRRRIYVFVARCTTECYKKNQKLLDKTVMSFTVKGNK